MGTVIDNSTIKKYPAYKDSGIEWSGLVPENWGALPIRAIFEERNEKNEGRKTDYILSVTKDRGVIPYDEKGAIGNNKSEDIERYKLVYPNDFVINKMNVVIGSLGMSKYFGAFSQVYLVYKPKTNQININYYSYIFSNPSFYKSLIKYCTGIMELRESLNKEDFKKLILPFPNYQTQTAIVDYLDRKTALIDQAINIKQKQIELLKERRQILIHKAVTRGLNPNVKMKNSGVEWIGEIPEGWEVKKLKYILIERNERSITGSEPLFMMSQIHGLVVRAEYHEKAEVANTSEGNKIVYKNDLVFNKLKAHLGVFFKSTIDFSGLVSPDYAVYYSNGIIEDVKFLEYLFRCPEYLKQFICRITGIVEGLMRLYTHDLFDISIPIPPKSDQKEILNFIHNYETKIATAISLKEQEIEKLKEYKAALINSAVTGKIKVYNDVK
jgi:type I restriction enzyme S subunit